MTTALGRTYDRHFGIDGQVDRSAGCTQYSLGMVTGRHGRGEKMFEGDIGS